MASGERESSRGVARIAGVVFALLCALAWPAACGSDFQAQRRGGPDGGSGGSSATDGSSGSPEAGPGGSSATDGSGDGAGPSGPFVDFLVSSRIPKVDLLLMVDNSIGMADKQRVFAEAIPELVQRFTNPICADPMTGIPDRAKTPADPTAACPAPLTREFAPIRNIHLGVITSSIGGHGSTTLCVGNDTGTIADQEQNDHGWLVGKRPRYMTPPGGWAAESSGFLDWNPDTHANQTDKAFGASASAMTLAAGEFGCGLESQLESIYRFLVDPNPYETITVQNCPGSSEPCAVPTGKDANLLAQRAAFLRPDSAVVVLMITDENDCSIQESGQYYYAARADILLPHGSAVCATNPNDKCCYFCNAAVPAGCAADPSCAQPTPRTQDQPNLRCFHQQQRFGFDFLYPTQRYVNALTQPQICTARADLAPDPTNCRDLDGDKKPDIFANPLFVGVNGTSAVLRDASLVFFGGIVGVPWQDLATNVAPTGEPYPSGELHFRTSRQLADDNAWPVILGDPNPYNNQPPIFPTDSLMLESKDPRGGADGEIPPRALAPTSAGYLANPVNGHEWVNADQDDLQYACIFELPTAQKRDCASVAMMSPMPSCDCKPGTESDNNPLCQGSDGAYSTTQGFAKAYPGLRELKVLKDFGNNAIVASICPRNVKTASAQDYGYRPAIDAVLAAVGSAFMGGKCLPRMLTPDAKTGKIPCTIVEVLPDGSASCDSISGRADIDAATRDAAKVRLEAAGFCNVAAKPSCEAFSYCQIREAGETCHKNQAPVETGWCYVDPAVQADDDTSLVAGCPASQQRLIRFVDPAGKTPAPGATTLIVCSGGISGEVP